jgi:hypothetical protein
VARLTPVPSCANGLAFGMHFIGLRHGSGK